MKQLYAQDDDFQESFEAYESPIHCDRGKWKEFMIEDGLLFRTIQLCIPKCSMRENLIREKHSGGLDGHFGQEKAFEQLQHFYYWPKMRSKVQNFMSSYKIFQHAKGKIMNIRLYTSFPIPNRP